ncbi:MAG: hypothetical protein RL553_2267, partial [Planctomycetota bacterium]
MIATHEGNLFLGVGLKFYLYKFSIAFIVMTFDRFWQYYGWASNQLQSDLTLPVSHN